MVAEPGDCLAVPVPSTWGEEGPPPPLWAGGGGRLPERWQDDPSQQQEKRRGKVLTSLGLAANSMGVSSELALLI